MPGDKLSVGDRVQVDIRHWIRRGELGTIEAVDYDRRSEHKFLVKFDKHGPGFDEGWYLWLGDWSFERL